MLSDFWSDWLRDGVLEAGLLLDCFKTIEYFKFRFWSQNNFLFFFQFFISKESKIYCISDCLRKGRNSAKSDWLLSIKDMTCFRNLEQLSRVPTKNDQYLLKEQRYHKIEARFGHKTTFILIKLLLYERFGTINSKLSSPFYCCISKLKIDFMTWNRIRDLPHAKQQILYWARLPPCWVHLLLTVYYD